MTPAHPHYSRGFQIELLNNGTVIDGKTFDDPEEYNTSVRSIAAWMKYKDLRYRVRFATAATTLCHKYPEAAHRQQRGRPSNHNWNTPVSMTLVSSSCPIGFNYFSLRPYGVASHAHHEYLVLSSCSQRYDSHRWNCQLQRTAAGRFKGEPKTRVSFSKK